MLSVEEILSLQQFSHRILWREEDPIWAPLLSLEKYLETHSYQIEIEIPPSVHLIHPEKISIGKGTILEPGVCIQGPCVIGEECFIRHGAFLRDGVICGNRCNIGHSAEIKHSILLDEACAAHFAYVGDSILGTGVNLGAGVKCANLRLDRKEIVLSFEGKRFETGLRKMGAIIGDRSQIGCNCVLNPGTIVGKGCLSYPLLNLGGVIPSNRVIKKENLLEPVR